MARSVVYHLRCITYRWHLTKHAGTALSAGGEPPYKGENPILPTADLELEGQLAGGLLQGTSVQFGLVVHQAVVPGCLLHFTVDFF